MTMMTTSQGQQPVSGSFRVDIWRGQRIGQVSSEWFARPDDERYLNLPKLYDAVRSRAECAQARTVESRSIRIEAARENAERLALIVPGRDEPVAPTHWTKRYGPHAADGSNGSTWAPAFSCPNVSKLAVIGTGQHHQALPVCSRIAERCSLRSGREGEFHAILLQRDRLNSAAGLQLLGSFTEALIDPSIARSMQIGRLRLGRFTRRDRKRVAKQRPRAEKEGFFTPYAPVVLTLRGPHAAISLG